MASALGTVLLYIGSFIEILDISIAVLASVLTALMVIEYGKNAPWAVFAATSILSLILLSYKLPAFMYVLFFGYYPIIKEKIERLKSKAIQWLIKIGVFSAASALLLFVCTVFTADLELSSGVLMTVAFVVLAEIMYVMYDIALTRIITLYLVRFRHRFKKLF